MPLQETSGTASYDAFGGGVVAEPNYIESCFSTWLYTGNGSTQTITNGIDLAGKGGLVWTKVRSTTYSHFLADTIRGAGSVLSTNNTNAADTGGNLYSGFNTNGYGVTTSYGSGTNGNGATFASWTFRKQPKFFDVVTYTGNGANRTIAHNLGATPAFIIVKSTSNVSDWVCYHVSLGATKYVYLNRTNASGTFSAYWNDTAPTSTVFSLGSDTDVNGSGQTYVAYLFAHNAGGFGLTGTDNVISCGSFTQSGGTATVNLGYEPQWILLKANSAGEPWTIVDNMRGMAVSGNQARLFPNDSSAEDNNISILTPTATGFVTNANLGGSLTYIYIAIRRGPMKTPTSGTSVFNPTQTSAVSGTTVTTNFPVDYQIIGINAGNASNMRTKDRLIGINSTTGSVLTPYLVTSSTAAETSAASSSLMWDNTGFQVPTLNSGNPTIFWSFRRAPGFFDEVCYTGTGGNPQTVNHNLGVAPNMVIVKRRDNATPNWTVGLSFTSTPYQDGLYLNATNALIAGDNELNGASATTISVRNTMSASGGTFVAYLFATCPGVSKVGSFTGTGNVLQIDCGFTGGARFVLIKATSTTGSWYVWDSARGIVAGNDPYLLLNSTAAEVTNTDWVDAYSAGFELSNAVGNTVNTNGTTYMYLAIA